MDSYFESKNIPTTTWDPQVGYMDYMHSVLNVYLMLHKCTIIVHKYVTSGPQITSN